MSETTNLKLKKHDNVTTNTNQFDIENYMNKNWDKIDEFAGQVNEDLDGKVEKVEGKGLSSNDFTNEFKQKLEGLENYDDTKVKQDIADLDLRKASKAELQEATIALQAELKATRKDLEASSLEGQGTGESLYLQDSSNARFRSFEISGNSKQEKREGYNLIDFNVGQGAKVTVNKDGSITINGTGGFYLVTRPFTLKSGKTYYQKYELVSGAISGVDIPFMGFKSSTWITKDTFLQYNPTEDTVVENVWVHAGATFENATIKIWAVEGQEKPYEQYGTMPSLEFPSEIQAVGQDVNIFDKDSAVKGVMLTATDEVQNDKYFTSDYIKVKRNTDYCTNEYAPVVKAFDINKNQIGYLRNVSTAGTFNTGNAEYIKARNSIQLETEEQMQNAMDNAKIVEGTEINGYSPYNCGSANITVCNKNTLSFLDFTHTENGITVKCQNNKVNISGTSTKGFSIFLTKYCNIKEINKIILNEKITLSSIIPNGIELNVGVSGNSYYMQLKGNTKSITKVLDKEISTIYLYIPNNITINQDLEIQLELNSATDYIEHEEQTLTMPVQQEMLEGDKFEKVNGVWKEKHTWKKVILGIEGNVSDYQHSTIKTDTRGFFRFLAIGKDKKNASGSVHLIHCNYLKSKSGNANSAIEKDCVWWEGSTESIYLSLPFTNKTEANNFLQEQYETGEPIIIYYKLEIPTYLDCTEAQIKVLDEIERTLHTYKNGTHVYCTDKISPIFNVRYTLDQKAYIDAQLKPIVQELTGGN